MLQFLSNLWSSDEEIAVNYATHSPKWNERKRSMFNKRVFPAEESKAKLKTNWFQTIANFAKIFLKHWIRKCDLSCEVSWFGCTITFVSDREELMSKFPLINYTILVLIKTWALKNATHILPIKQFENKKITCGLIICQELRPFYTAECIKAIVGKESEHFTLLIVN